MIPALAAESALSLIWRHWKLILGGLIVAALSVMLLIAKGDARHWRKMHAQEETAHHLTVANYEKARAKARADDLANAAKVKAEYDALAQENQRALETQLADARAAAARYAERMRAPGENVGNRSGGEGLPGTPSTTLDPPQSGDLAVIPVADLDICAVNTVIAKGWQEWWAGASAVER
jgi:hypothetical protein